MQVAAVGVDQAAHQGLVPADDLPERPGVAAAAGGDQDGVAVSLGKRYGQRFTSRDHGGSFRRYRNEGVADEGSVTESAATGGRVLVGATPASPLRAVDER